MSKIGSAAISCPQCGYESEAKIYESINVTLDPDAKQNALNGTLSMFKCPQCGLEAPLNASLLYHDMDRKLMIYIAPSEEDVAQAHDAINALFGDELSSTLVGNGYTFRIVRTSNELKEKVKIFEEGRDDRALEVCKLIIISELLSNDQELPDYEEFLYAHESEEEGALVFAFVGEECASIAFPKDGYLNIAEDIAANDIPPETYIIDFNWAKQFLTSDDADDQRSEAQDQGEIVGDLKVFKILDFPFRVPKKFMALKSLPEDKPGQITLASHDDGTAALLKVNTILPKYAMPYKKQKKILKGIYESLEEDQGLVEVGTGIMGYSGRSYAYSIVKTKVDPSGVQYCLLLHIKNDGHSTEVQGFFDEAGTTGVRDSMVFSLKQQEGEVNISEEGFVGWTKDPYDERRKEGFLMNLSESKEYDSMFPNHSLTELREVLNVLINNN